VPTGAEKLRKTTEKKLFEAKREWKRENGGEIRKKIYRTEKEKD
jgi:hypothetical protein